jgi:pimeloyl-ACP methyl ester carboxylesterase
VIDGSRFVYSIPGQVDGILFLFHGHNGDADQWFDRIETLVVVQEALSRNLIVIAQQSYQDGVWDPFPHDGNRDILGYKEVLRYLEDNETLPHGTPRYAIGHSMGGVHVTTLTQRASVDRVAIMNAPQHQMLDFDASLLPPTLYYAAENDGTADAESIAAAYENISATAEEVELFVAENSPLTPGAFHRIPGIDCEKSQELYSSLEYHWVLNQEGLQVMTPAYSNYEKAIEETGLDEYKSDILMILKAHYALHTFSSVEKELVFSHLLESR